MIPVSKSTPTGIGMTAPAPVVLPGIANVNRGVLAEVAPEARL